MITMKSRSILASLAILTLAAGCGGGSSDDGAVLAPPSGGIGRNGVAVGPIANFGSVIVNGVTYNTDNASFEVNDAPGTQSDLRVGDYVIVQGTINNDGVTGVATSVFYDDLVKGPVDSIDAGANTLVVLGQPVIITTETSFDDGFSASGLDGVSVGQIVEVSGIVDANDNIVASRIEPKPVGTQYEVRGTVSNLDSTNLEFSLRGLVVDYSQATLDDFAGGMIVDGDLVEAKGTMLGSAGELVATEVEFEGDELNVEDGDAAEIEGFVTRFASATDFDVAGIPVTTNSGTEYEDGTAADLALNIKIEVEGSFDANGVLVADEIEFRVAKSVRVAALVDDVDAANNSLTVLGIPVDIDSLTRIEDKTDARLEPLNVSDIAVGDYIEVRGSEQPADSGRLSAALLERDDPDPEVELRGFVTAVAEPAYSVLGVTVNTDANTVFRDENEVVISAAEFFSRVAAGALVEADGTEISATSILADEVEFEND